MSTPLPPGILEALQIAPGTIAPDSRSFQESLLDLTLPHQSDDGVLTNKYDLLCPRGCRSVILKRGVGQLVERSGIEMDSPGHPVDPALDPLPAPPATVSWWLVTPSPMEFENVGFSRPVPAPRAAGGDSAMSGIWSSPPFLFPPHPSASDPSTCEMFDVGLLPLIASSKSIKFLICADCDVGPLGWCEEGGKEFWLACSRVRYAVANS